MNKNSMLNWWPLVATARVQKPKTALVKVEDPQRLWEVLEGRSSWPGELIYQLIMAIRVVGTPAFIRGDLVSGKHGDMTGWRLNSHDINEHDLPTLNRRLYNIVEAQAMGPEEMPEAFAVRRFIPLNSSFEAFHGLPIARERRYFVNEGKVICHHVYWPQDAIQFYSEVKELRGDFAHRSWQDILAHANTEHELEVERLTRYARLLSNRLPGYWSVDFAHAKDGRWLFIDAATGEESWHPPCGAMGEPVFGLVKVP